MIQLSKVKNFFNVCATITVNKNKASNPEWYKRGLESFFLDAHWCLPDSVLVIKKVLRDLTLKFSLHVDTTTPSDLWLTSSWKKTNLLWRESTGLPNRKTSIFRIWLFSAWEETRFSKSKNRFFIRSDIQLWRCWTSKRAIWTLSTQMHFVICPTFNKLISTKIQVRL
jgi:hypothetical protein